MTGAEKSPPEAVVEAPRAEGPGGGAFFRAALAITALSLAARAVAALQTRVITPDGVEFVAIAKKFAAGEWSSALAHSHHPLYPFLVSIAGALTGNFDFAAPAVSVAAGGLCALPLVLLCRGAFGARGAVFAGCLYAVLPAFVRLGADALSDATFHFFALCAFAAAFQGFFGGAGAARRFLAAALAGALAGAAYWVRPEGVLIPAAIAAFAAAAAALRRKSLARAGLPAVLVAAVFCAAALPYVLHVRAQTGRFDLTKKKPASNLLNVYQGEQGEESATPERTDLPGSSSIPGAVFLVAAALAHDFFYLPAVLVLAGLLARGKDRTLLHELFLLAPVLLWFCVCFLLARSHGYLSHRHTAPAALLLMGFAGRGVLWTAAALARLEWGALKRVTPGARATGAAVLIALLIASFGSVSAFRAYRAGKRYVKEIGAELKALGAEGKTVLGNRIRITHYAGARHVDLPAMTCFETVLRRISDEGADFLVIDLLDPHFPVRYRSVLDRFGGGKPLPPGFTPLREWKLDGSTGRVRDVRAYRIDRGALESR